jgi:DNA polymerase I-like protein with 3'-5' exonuclease and polymerase domains
MALASVDYCQQEFGIGAALSEDPAMAEIYRAGDLYMALAIRVGAAPEGATAETHPEARDRHKTVTLATQFGQTEVGLGQRLDIPPIYAARLIEDFWKSFPRYRQWSRDVYDTACLRRPRVMEAAFGWRATCGPFLERELSIRNWPLQATGSEILRVAMLKCMEEGVRVCAPIHDALLIEAPERDVKDAIETTQRVMREAGEVALSGFVLRTDAKVIRHPNRYADKRGVDTWNTIHEMLGLEQ